MAWVGLSPRVFRASTTRRRRGGAWRRREALADGASPREQRRIALRAKQLDAMSRPRQTRRRHADYKKAIDEALATDIGDAELWLIRGNAEEATAAGRGQRGGAASTAFYRRRCGSRPTTGPRTTT